MILQASFEEEIEILKYMIILEIQEDIESLTYEVDGGVFEINSKYFKSSLKRRFRVFEMKKSRAGTIFSLKKEFITYDNLILLKEFDIYRNLRYFKGGSNYVKAFIFLNYQRRSGIGIDEVYGDVVAMIEDEFNEKEVTNGF